MSDRALQISVGFSLAIHLIVSIGLSGERWTRTIVRPPAQAPPVRVRLGGPPSEAARAEPPRPSVSAAPARSEPVVSPPERAVIEPLPPKPSTPAIRETDPPEPDPESQPVASELVALDVESSSNARPVDGGLPGPTAPDRFPGPGSAEAEEEDRLARYVETVRSRIQARKRYPPLARKRAAEGRVLARVAIRADGRLISVELDGDASPLLRRATDEAIRSAAPYPAPPAGAITIELPVEYSLRDSS